MEILIRSPDRLSYQCRAGHVLDVLDLFAVKTSMKKVGVTAKQGAIRK